ncbi:hypothetical protein [Pseudomonas gingeri]
MCSWGLNEVRVAVLDVIDTYVNDLCTCAPAQGGTLLYPGSGADIANALFSSASRIDTFVFVDNWQGGGGVEVAFEKIAEALRKAIPDDAAPEPLAAEDVRAFATQINIASACPMLAFQFMFKGRARRLLFLRTSLERFFTDNGGFRCHVVFVKDLGGTTSTVSCEMALPCLHLHGLFVTNETILHIQLYGLRRLVSLVGVGYGDTVVAHKVRDLDVGILQGVSEFADQLKRAADAFFAEYEDTYDFLSLNYGAVQPHEVKILADGMARIKPLLTPYGLTPDEQFEICKSVLQAGTWVPQWDHDIPAYLAAWQLQHMQAHTAMLLNRPRPPGRPRTIKPSFH